MDSPLKAFHIEGPLHVGPAHLIPFGSEDRTDFNLFQPLIRRTRRFVRMQ